MIRPAIATTLAAALLLAASGCSKATWKKIGDDTRKAAETTGKAIEGAVQGGIDAVKGD